MKENENGREIKVRLLKWDPHRKYDRGRNEQTCVCVGETDRKTQRKRD